MVHSLDQWELDLRIVKFFDMYTTCLAGGNDLNINDLDGMGTSTMTSTHIAIALCHGITDSQITVFTVHVVSAGTRVITQPDAEIFDLNGRCLVDLFQADNLTGGLLELFQLAQEVPETGLGDNAIGSKDSHFVERSRGLLLCWQLAANDLVFLQLQIHEKKRQN